jgi:thiamine pyrophosphate-dependent acetolactate synthase large subunit-like protein
VVPAPTIDAPAVKILNRADLTKRLVAKLARAEAVLAGIGNTNFRSLCRRASGAEFYMLGSMGLACPIALGVAIAQLERGVIALEGDGSILMALGCLATIGMIRPRNLTIIIMDNGIYQITGKQAAATASSADIVAIARGAGITQSHWVRDETHFDKLASRRFDAGGPVLLAAKIDDAPGIGQTVRDPPLIRHRFMRGLGTGRASALDG